MKRKIILFVSTLFLVHLSDTWASSISESIHADMNRNDPAAVEAAISAHPEEVNRKDGWGRTLLSWASTEAMAAIFLSHGADMEVQDQHGLTPLLVAIDLRHAEEVEFLIKRGANIQVRDNDGRTALHRAALVGNADLEKFLLLKKFDANTLDNKGETPLFDAVVSGSTQTVHVLLKNGANVNILTHNGKTPLHYAAMMWPNVVELLIRHGARINVKDNEGLTPLLWAARSRRMDSIVVLEAHGAIEDPESKQSIAELRSREKIHDAASVGDLVRIKELTASDLSLVNLKVNGATPLQAAIFSRQRPSVELLLSYGADPNAKNARSETVLRVAVEQDLFDLAELLMAHGADVNAQDDRGWTALHSAVAQEKGERVKWLLSHKANANVQNAEGKTPLDIAMTMKMTEITRLITNAYPHLQTTFQLNKDRCLQKDQAKACFEAATTITDPSQAEPDEAMKLLHHGCDLGDRLYSCLAYGNMLLNSGYQQEAAGLFNRLCKEGEKRWCGEAASLMKKMGFKDEARTRFAKLCMDSNPSSGCVDLGELSERSEDKETLRVRCGQKNRGACEALAAAYSQSRETKLAIKVCRDHLEDVHICAAAVTAVKDEDIALFFVNAAECHEMRHSAPIEKSSVDEFCHYSSEEYSALRKKHRKSPDAIFFIKQAKRLYEN